MGWDGFSRSRLEWARAESGTKERSGNSEFVGHWARSLPQNAARGIQRAISRTSCNSASLKNTGLDFMLFALAACAITAGKFSPRMP